MQRQERIGESEKRRNGEVYWAIPPFSHSPILRFIYLLCLLLTAYSLLVGIAHPTATAFAQETVSLSSLIEEAKKNNPEILAYQKRVKAKEHRAKVEGILDDPQLKVEIEDIPKDNPFNLVDSMRPGYPSSQCCRFQENCL